VALTYGPLTEADKRAICVWTYPGKYALYNLPPYEEMQAKQRGFCHPEREANYLAFHEADGLAGFVNIRAEENTVFIGIGVHPERCGQGLGQRILRKTASIAHERHPGKTLYLEVRTWNIRAIRCYEKEGFRIVGEAFEQVTGSGKGMFYRMIHP